MEMLRENLKIALNVAIGEQQRYERVEIGFDKDSSLLAGWRQVLEALNRGEEVRIVEESSAVLAARKQFGEAP